MNGGADLEREFLNMEEDLLYSEKANFQICNVWGVIYWILGLSNATLAALAGFASSDIFLAEHSAFFGLSVAIIAALMTFINPNRRAEVSHKAGVSFSDLRGRVRRYREHKLTRRSEEEAIEALEEFASLKTQLLSSTPHTGLLAYWLAKISIRRRQHLNQVE